MVRVLIVDDFPVVRRGLVEILSESLRDARFGEAGTSEEALESLGKDRWDLALIDLTLPGRDGLWLLEELRRRYPEVPGLILSDYPDAQLAVRCLRMGAAGYVTKDSAPSELAAATRKTLAGRKYVPAALGEKLADVAGSGGERASHDALSNRELQVLRLVATGRSLKQIAAELKLSEKTVATYRARINEKLQISTNVELTRYALRHNLVK
jgi:two-component system, NarL family, invasion response regulator UvrY